MDRSGLPSTRTSPSSGLIEAVDEVEELGAPGPDEPAEADDLARVNLQAHAANGGEPP